jgi:MoaA/NifB/PqqE/SkfB family radical SAM enzyme
MISETFCILPFVHLNFKSRGRISSCCMDKKFYSKDKTITLENLWNSDEINSFREQLINGEKPDRCSKCWDFESSGASSLRKRENLLNSNKEQIIHFFKEHKKVPTENLDFVEVRFDNICNLMCRMCGTHSSNKWAVEVSKNKPLLFEMSKYGAASEYDINNKDHITLEIIDELIKNSKNLRRVNLSGGEPLYSPKHFDFIERLLPESNHIKLMYSTNLTLLTYKGKNIIDLWKKFKSVELRASIDGHTPQLYSYIRVTGSLLDVEKNISELKKISSIKIYAKATFTLLNILYLVEIAEYFNKLDLPFASAIVQEPSALNIKLLPTQLKIEITEKWKKYIINKTDKSLIFWGNHVINYMNSENLFETKWNIFKTYINEMDKNFKTNIIDVNPEFKMYWD